MSKLTAKRLREALAYNPQTGVFTRLPMGRSTGTVDKASPYGYVSISVDGVVYRAHRLAVLWMTGDWPTGEVDHRDGDGSNNRWLNLRDVTKAINQQNRPRLSGRLLPRGVTTLRDRFAAKVQANGRRIHVGTFDTPEEAGAAAAAARGLYHAGAAPTPTSALSGAPGAV